MSNLFQRLRDLVPQPPVLVGTVLAHHADDTSTVEIPGALPITGAGPVSTGSLIRPRGTTVPVGAKAFIRAGVIETRAPDSFATPFAVGRVVVAVPLPPPPPPAPTRVRITTANGRRVTSTGGLRVLTN